MAKIILKTVERKTSVTREVVRNAIATVLQGKTLTEYAAAVKRASNTRRGAAKKAA